MGTVELAVQNTKIGLINRSKHTYGTSMYVCMYVLDLLLDVGSGVCKVNTHAK